MNFIKTILPYAIIVAVVILIRTFVLTPVIVSGTSMDDTLKNGELLLLKKYDKNFERFDIVVFDYGETLEYKDGILYINGKETEDPFASSTKDFKLTDLNIDVIPEDYYFVMGDNRSNSSDSRIIGPISKDTINGTTSFSLWPFGTVE